MGFLDRFKKKTDDEPTYSITDISSNLESKKDDDFDVTEEERIKKEVNSGDKDLVDMLYEHNDERKEEPIKEEEPVVEKEPSYFEQVIDEIDKNRDNQEANNSIDTDRKEFNDKYSKIRDLMSADWAYKETGEIPNFGGEYLEKLNSLKYANQKLVFLPYLLEKKAYGLANQQDLRDINEKYGTGEELKKNYTFGLILDHFIGLVDINDPEVFSKTFDEYSIYKRFIINEIALTYEDKVKKKQL